MTPLRVLAAPLLAFSSYAATAPAVAGDYVEVRSNHVYTCGCLYSGETVTSGREAILAWAIREGAFQGVPLTGSRAVAVLQGQSNLSLQGTARQSVLFVDTVSEAQQQALAGLLREHYGTVLGEVLSVRRAPISFEKAAGRVTVSVAELARVVLRPARLPDDAHLGSTLWYAPFIAATDATLGTSEYRKFSGGDFDNRWWSSEPGIFGYIASFSVGQ